MVGLPPLEEIAEVEDIRTGLAEGLLVFGVELDRGDVVMMAAAAEGADDGAIAGGGFEDVEGGGSIHVGHLDQAIGDGGRGGVVLEGFLAIEDLAGGDGVGDVAVSLSMITCPQLNQSPLSIGALMQRIIEPEIIQGVGQGVAQLGECGGAGVRTGRVGRAGNDGAESDVLDLHKKVNLRSGVPSWEGRTTMGRQVCRGLQDLEPLFHLPRAAWWHLLKPKIQPA
jgi:hypothetical protein